MLAATARCCRPTRRTPGALLFIDHITSPETLELNMSKFSLPSVLNATYDAPAVKKAVPYAAQLKAAIEAAKARPVSPVYPQISQAIYNNVNAALSGKVVAAGGDEDRGRPRSTRRWRPSSAMATGSRHSRKPTRGGAPGASRSAASRCSWSSPSMTLIALVALWPVIYGDLAVACTSTA